MKKFIFTLLLIFAVSVSISKALQTRLPDHKNIKQYNSTELRSLAKNAENNNDYYSAIEFYQELYSRKQVLNVAFKLGGLYESLHEYQIAMEYYEESINTQDKKSKSLYFYAKMLKMNGYTEKAMNSFKKFLRVYRGKDQRKFRLLTLNHIKGCKMIISGNYSNKNIELTSLPSNINSNHIEYSPIPLNDTAFLFGSIRSDKKLITSAKRKLYLSSKVNENWTIEEFNKINPVYEDIVNATISPGGDIMFITRLENTLISKNIRKIYMLKKINGKWGNAILLGKTINAPNSNNTQPTVSYDSNKNTMVLYFASDRSNGFGGFDIWYSFFDASKNKFSKARNLGNRINSIGDEITPYYNNKNNTLYFSSNGHPGFGGFDVFSSRGERNYWRSIENIGEPINSSLDELYYVLNSQMDKGYFVSNRVDNNGSIIPNCCDNLFAFVNKNEIKIDIKGKIYAKANNPQESITLENIYYEYDQFNLTGGTKNYLDTTLLKLLRENEDIEIELSSHTDNIGTSDYNKTLSNKRAASVKKYLVANGIDENRISSIGYGEEMPIADNDGPKGRKLNRRTEFKIITKDNNYVQNK